jgi:hypothetical protein
MSEPISYKKQRLDEQINWHSKRARQSKFRFRLGQIITHQTTITGMIGIFRSIARVISFRQYPLGRLTEYGVMRRTNRPLYGISDTHSSPSVM